MTEAAACLLRMHLVTVRFALLFVILQTAAGFAAGHPARERRGREASHLAARLPQGAAAAALGIADGLEVDGRGK